MLLVFHKATTGMIRRFLPFARLLPRLPRSIPPNQLSLQKEHIMLNILTEPLIDMTTAEGTLPASLPEVYAALMADEVEAFPALRPHQRHAWHAFLVQLGAMAMHRAGVTEPPEDAATWAELIRGLTPEFPDDEPWQLVVDDITKPAFMQPPASSSDVEKDYKTVVATPDALDMLITSKNHDLKATTAIQGSAEDWIFALVDLQTMEGFGGAGNYGISRMNGGLGSRPAFSLAPLGGPGAHARRDILALLSNYPTSAGAKNLLWLLPWDGTGPERLLPNELAPLYIEVCRRVRLRADGDGQIYAIRTSSKAARVEGKDAKGRTGDPWTPHNPSRDGLPLTLAAGGFNYKRMKEYLMNWRQPDLLKPTSAERSSSETMQLVARAMVRGQGKTEGYHERIVPIRTKTRNAMLRRTGRDSMEDLGGLAEKRIERISAVQRILSHAIQVFAARGDSDNVSPEHRRLAAPWLNRLDEIIDDRFFDDLQDEFEAGDDATRERVHNDWLRDFVVPQARGILRDATDSLPCPAIHRYRARENATGLFEGRLSGNSGLPFLFDHAEEGNA